MLYKAFKISGMIEVETQNLSLQNTFLRLRDMYLYLRRKWILFILVGIIGLTYGYIVSANKKTIYSGRLTFVLDAEKSGVGAAGGLASQFGFDMGGGGGSVFSGDNLLELMKSRLLIERALLNTTKLNGKDITFADYFILVKDWRKNWVNTPLRDISFPVNVSRTTYTFRQDSLLGVLYKTLWNQNLVIKQADKKVTIFEIIINSEDEVFSKVMVENLLTVVSQFYIETKTKKTATNVAILQRQVDSVKGELSGAIAGVAMATDKTFNLNQALNIKRSPSQRRQVDVQTNTTVLGELVRNLESSKLALLNETPLLQIIDRPIYPLDKQRVSVLRKSVISAVFFSIIFAVILIIVKLGKDFLRSVKKAANPAI